MTMEDPPQQTDTITEPDETVAPEGGTPQAETPEPEAPEPEAPEPDAPEPETPEPEAEEPAVEAPAAEEPAAEEPVAEEPAAEEPAAEVEEPAAEEPAADVEEPAASELDADEPAVEEAVAEVLASEEAPADEPVAEEPAVEAPAAKAPAKKKKPAKKKEAAAEAADDAAGAPEGNGSGADPFRGPGDWYVIHTYAGYENKVKANLETRVQTMQMQEKIFDVQIPMEDVMEIKGGKKQVVQKKVFPGYLLVKMVYDDDSWVCVRNTPGVTGFVSSGTGQKPTPLSRREVEKILTVEKEETKKPAFRLDFEEGDVVRIISGPFADFNGTIADINVPQSKVRVMVNIFDRETPVELSFDQVARV
jgi:transcriptional antiterminator NusG